MIIFILHFLRRLGLLNSTDVIRTPMQYA